MKDIRKYIGVCLAAYCVLLMWALSAFSSASADEGGGGEEVKYSLQWVCPVFDDIPPAQAGPPIAVSGTVFEDLNKNGARDEGEKGLAGVLVSDGLQVVKTGADGVYSIEGTRPGISRFVFVVTPSGHRIGGKFYHAVPEKSGDLAADFPLAPDPRSTNANHSFAHVTDTHITGKTSCFADMQLPPDCSFIVVTGDLTNDGRYRAQLEAYVGAAALAPVTVMSLPGNHDLQAAGWGERAGGDVYEELLGPKYYAFEYGGRLYILLNSVEEMSRQTKWIENIMAFQPPGKEALTFQHFPPTDAGFRNFEARPEMEQHQRHNVIAVFAGHWHAERLLRLGKTLYVQTPPLTGRATDMSPAQYRIITFDDGRIEITNCSMGYGNLNEFAEPAADVSPDAPAIRPGRDWPMFKGNQSGSGAAADSVKPPFAVAWRQSLDATILMASPVVRGGVVYVGAGDGRNNGRSGVFALDAATGKLLWRYPTAAKVAHSVSAADGAVFAASNDGVIHAIDAKSGNGLWTHSLGSPLECWQYSPPLVSDKRVYAGMGQHFAALDARTGSPVWRLPESSVGAWTVYSGPVAADGKLFCAFPGLDARMSDPLTGGLLWQGMQGDKRLTIDAATPATPAIVGKIVYVFSGRNLHALNADTGIELWQRPNAGNSSPVASGDGVIICAGDKVIKLDQAGGEVWTHSAGGLRDGGKPKFFFDPLFISTPVVSGGIVYASTTDGQLLALDEADGSGLYTMELGRPFTASPAISGNAVFLASYDGAVWGLVSTSTE